MRLLWRATRRSSLSPFRIFAVYRSLSFVSGVFRGSEKRLLRSSGRIQDSDERRDQERGTGNSRFNTIPTRIPATMPPRRNLRKPPRPMRSSPTNRSGRFMTSMVTPALREWAVREARSRRSTRASSRGLRRSSGRYLGISAEFSRTSSGVLREGSRRRGGHGGASQGASLRYDLQIDFHDAIYGTKAEIQYSRNEACAACKGTGAAGGSGRKMCTTCQGAGQGAA